MSIRMLVLGAVVLGAAGQLACLTEAEAARPKEPASAPAQAPCKGEGKFCGGIAGFQCEEGLQCVDDPGDTCHPDTGADCGGICVCADKGPEKPSND